MSHVKAKVASTLLIGVAAAAAEPIDPSDRQTAAAALSVLLHKTSDVRFFIRAYLAA